MPTSIKPDNHLGGAHSAHSARGQLLTMAGQLEHPAANRYGLSHPPRHEVSHETSRSHTQAGPADVRPSDTQASAYHTPQTSSSDHPPLAQRIASTLRRSSSAVHLLQDKQAPQPEEAETKPPQPWVTGSTRRSSSSSSSFDRQPSIATSRPSNVSSLTSLAHSPSSREWHDPKSESSHQGHSLNSADTFESEEVDLDELRRIIKKMEERETNFVKRNGRKLHRHPASAVPYPRSYDREVVDHDVWCLMWAHQFSGNVAWHLYKTAPPKVLDLGCGTGTWILDAAKKWKDTHFVGLDIVPLHPNLEEIDPILAWRVTWVQANFLEQLPFDDGEFEFIHVRRIARGIPEDKWDHVLEEISRILKPGGAFQISEEDLTFPGIRQELPVKSDDPTATANPDEPFSVGSPLARPRAPTPSSSMINHDQDIPTSAIPNISQGMSFQSDAGSFISPHDSSNNLPEETPINPHDHSLLEFIYNEMHAARFINLMPLSLLSNMLPLYFQGVRTHPPLMTMFPPPPHESCNLGTGPPPQNSTAKSTQSGPHLTKNYVIRSQDEAPPSESDPADDLMSSETIATQVVRLDLAHLKPSPDGKTPFVGVPQLIAGSAKYVSVDMARYVAYAPRSLFRPNQFQQKEPVPPLPKGAKDSDSQNAAGGAGGGAKETSGKDRLPITAIKFDARTLNLHLSLRVQEVLACAEAMWEFVESYQERAGLDPPERKAPSVVSSLTGSDPTGAKPPRPVRKTTRNPNWRELLSLRRSGFDALLMRFKFDMEDCLGFNAVLEDRLGWKPVPVSRSEERMEFDAMCDAWAEHQDLRANSTSFSNDVAPRLSIPSVPRSSISMDSYAARSDEGQDTLRGPRSGAYSALQTVRESEDLPRISQGESIFTGRPRRQHPIPPHERLSRTIRLFVAFKPS
ncbi:uncharacterized protein C8Q71DRAFT_350714 [Rhodofomes roseus]|uniref:Methyltransferase domain-containing protein n=1 Tax=Rhodofomes roseus TaxID=34475 RepID=A0ABQ8KSN6_9APHY|nr:uncharacterized protein C8Q71DRAFT_350714 [Rhodofomes roseus]KAH9841838.1 hypothetical protein C8Q71DRAFT_350714 [Rhodofomes roseus]